MRYWWVSQNKTFEQEFDGGFLWSPKRKSNNARNPYYEFMREVAPGDLVFSFKARCIPAMAVAISSAYEAPKPAEFGSAGDRWSDIGWRVDVRYFPIEHQVRPVDHIQALRAHLPPRYSPLTITGDGNELYLTLLPDSFAHVLIGLIGLEAAEIRTAALHGLAEGQIDRDRLDVAVGLLEWENHLIDEVKGNREIPETEREAIVIARRGQGRFKEAVMKLERRCRITGVDRIEHLRASHIRPWRDCEDHRQRLDGSNGLLLTPSIDHLFDRGFISFESNGELLVSPAAHRESLKRMGVELERVIRVGTFTNNQKEYLEFHRDKVFLQAQVKH